MVGEDLTKQGNRYSEQELETVMGRDVTVFHTVSLYVGTVGMRELGSCTVHHVKEGVNRLMSDMGVVIGVGLKQIEGRGLPTRGGHSRGNFTRWWW